MDITKLPETLTLNQVKALRNAFGHFYDQEQNSKYIDRQTGFRFENVTDFVDYLYSPEIGIPKGTSAKHMAIILESWYETLSKAPEFSEPTMTPAPKYTVESNTLTPDQLKQLEKEDESRTIKLKETRVEAEKDIESAIEKKEELVREAEIRESLKNKKIVVTPTEDLQKVNLTPKEKEQLFNLSQAIKTDPGTVQQMIEQRVKDSVDKSAPEIKGSITQPVIKKFATSLIEKTEPLSGYKTPSELPDEVSVLNPVSPLISISDPNNPTLKKLITDNETRISLAQKAQAVAAAIEAENNVNYTLTNSLFLESENISGIFYPQKITEFQIAEYQESQEQKDEGVEIDLGNVYDNGRDVWDVWQKLANGTTTVDEVVTSTVSQAPTYVPSTNLAVTRLSSSFVTTSLPATTGAIVGFGGGVLASQLFTQQFRMLANPQTMKMITASGFESVSIAAPMTAGKLLFNLNLGKVTFSVISGPIKSTQLYIAGIKFGEKLIAGYVGVGGKTIAAGTLSKVGGQIVAKAIPSAVLSKIGAIIGQLGTPIVAVIAAAVGWVVGKIIEKINWKKVKEWGAAIIGGFAGLIALPFVGLGAAIGIGVGTTAVAAGLGAGLGGATLAGIGSGMAGFFGALGGAFLGAIGMPIIITLLVFPVVVALILFIINSGAYIVPPGASGGINDTSCTGAAAEKPIAIDTVYSKDGKYAFPLANAGKIGLSCTHWDKSLATDIFTGHFTGDKFPVLAYTGGVIEGVSLNDSLGGKYIILKGNDGRYYYYAHNCMLYVKPGDTVKVGDVMATTDNTGSAAKTPEHLHFAISYFPSFGGGGTVCPSKDFEDKFNLGRCKPSNECIP